MMVSFYDVDTENHLCDMEKEDINSFIIFLRNVDNVHLYIGEDNYVNGKIDEMTFDVEYHEEGFDERLIVKIKEIK